MSAPRKKKQAPGASENARPIVELVQAGMPAATVVVPDDGSLDTEAIRVVDAIRARTGVQLPRMTGKQALRELPTRYALTLGCMADNAFIEALYFRWNTLVDRWYPGPGGWVIQMIASPRKRGHHVLLLGAGDAQGVGCAIEHFIEELERNPDGVIPWQLTVKLGADHLPLPEDRMDALGTAASPVMTPESALPDRPYEPGFNEGSARNHLLRLGMYGPHADNYHLSRSSQLGLRFLYTGREADARFYRSTLLEEARTGALQKCYHYKSLRTFQLWSLLGACPVFSDAERSTVTRAIVDYLLEESGMANTHEIREGSRKTEIFNRHQACDALNLWVGADWLWRETGDDAWLAKRSVADTYFQAQSGTDVPLTGLTEGYASYLEVFLEWMLLSCPEQIADDPHIRIWAHRVMGLCTNAGQLVLGPQTDAARYPYHLMCKLAHLLADGRYLFVANRREHQVRSGMDRVIQFSAGQAYAGNIEARVPEEIGLITTPINERLRLWKAPSIRADQGFDRAVGRSGWQLEDDYLMIVGVRSGAKSLPNIGALAAYERFGERLITSDSVPLYPHSASPWRHSGVTVNASGLGAGMAEGAEVLRNEASCGGHILAYEIHTPGFFRWVRVLYWKPAAYVLIVDRVAVDGDDVFTLGVNWRCAGRIVELNRELATLGLGPGTEGRFYVQVSEGLRLAAETMTFPVPGAPPGTAPITEHMLHATMDRHPRDGEVEVATLLHAVKGSGDPNFHLGVHDEVWTVEGPDGVRQFETGNRAGKRTIEVALEKERAIPCHAGRVTKPEAPQRGANRTLPTRWTFDLPARVSAWTQATKNSAVAVGTERGDIIVLDRDGKPEWSARCDTAVTALTFYGNDLIVGTRSGQVCRFEGTGDVQWRHQCRFRVERPFWSWWFLETPVAAALAVGRDPASGQDLVAVGTGSTSLNFLDARTGALLGDLVSPYGLPDRIRASMPARAGELRFMVGHSWLTCGSTVRTWTPLPQPRETMAFERSVEPMGRTTDGWDMCGTVDFRITPLVFNGPDHVIVLRHGAVNQITAYEEATGVPLWDATLGGAPVGLAVLAGESAAAARCCVAEQFGWLVVFDGSGKRVAATHLAHSLLGMCAGPEDAPVLWNRDALFIARADQTTDMYRLEGTPLGWVKHPQTPGLLCIHGEQLMMQPVL